MIRLAEYNDLEEIMNIKKEIVAEMKNEGNPQWHESYPSLEDFKNDIATSSLYVYIKDTLVGFICIKKDLENEYGKVENSTKDEAYIMHRLGVKKEFRHEGIASLLISHAEKLALNNKVYLMKADTEVSNKKMNNLFIKLGYKKISTLTWSDNDGLFNYYEKGLEANE